MDIRTRFLATVTSHFGVIETREADPLDAVVRRDLKPDSLDLIELAVAIEDEFAIELTDDELAAMPSQTTLREIMGLVEGKLPGRIAA